MKRNYKLLLVFLLLIIFPISVKALSKDYEDKLYTFLGKDVIEDKINIYFFYGDGCPHCKAEETFFNDLAEKYSDKYNFYMYETWNSKDNTDLMYSAKEIMGDTVNRAVPYTVIGTESFTGYNDFVGTKIENLIIHYTTKEEEKEEKPDEYAADKYKEEIPFIGVVDKRDVSIGLVAVILGFVDGFNPCAMWILLFLINMLIGMHDKKKMLIIGFVFLLTSAVMYFLFMLGIANILSFLSTKLIRRIIGIVAIAVGSYNVYRFFKERKQDAGCHVVDETKRKKIFSRIKKFTTEKNLFIALGGVILLAISVNTVELACSSVFPATFAEILAVNEVSGISRIIYLLIYTFFYMIDDLIVFIIAVATLELSTTSSKYGKYSSIVGGIIMLLVGLLLIFKPEWLMLNF